MSHVSSLFIYYFIQCSSHDSRMKTGDIIMKYSLFRKGCILILAHPILRMHPFTVVSQRTYFSIYFLQKDKYVCSMFVWEAIIEVNKFLYSVKLYLMLRILRFLKRTLLSISPSYVKTQQTGIVNRNSLIRTVKMEKKT